MALGACAVIASCRSGPKNFDNENDELRRKLTDAEARIASLEAERSELAAKLAELTRTFEGAGGEPGADVIASMPRCAGISIGRLSGLADADDNGVFERVDLYVRPYDGRQRFIQIAGRMKVSATLVPAPGSAAAPRTLGTAVLLPYDLREAYRSSPMGTHYTATIMIDPLPAASANAGSLVLVAEFEDAITGQVHTAQSTVALGASAGPGG